jgi:hypothetical protein
VAQAVQCKPQYHQKKKKGSTVIFIPSFNFVFINWLASQENVTTNFFALQIMTHATLKMVYKHELFFEPNALYGKFGRKRVMNENVN